HVAVVVPIAAPWLRLVPRVVAATVPVPIRADPVAHDARRGARQAGEVSAEVVQSAARLGVTVVTGITAPIGGARVVGVAAVAVAGGAARLAGGERRGRERGSDQALGLFASGLERTLVAPAHGVPAFASTRRFSSLSAV